MIYLRKILPVLVSPLLIFILIVLIYAQRKRSIGLLLATLTFAFTSTPFTANKLWSILESESVPISAQSAQTTEVIVVLSGMIRGIDTDTGQNIQWGGMDRFFKGIDLLKAEKANALLFTGGSLPWEKLNSDEGTVLKQKAIEMNVPKEKIIVTPRAANTAQEATRVRQTVGPITKRITLVTSAFHMPRAAKLFEQEGFDVYRFPVDFRSRIRSLKTTPMDFIPSTTGLNRTFSALREFLGRTYYELRSWIKMDSAPEKIARTSEEPT